MKVLIVEDETVAYNNLKNILAEIDRDIKVLGNTESVTQTVNRLQDSDNMPDLIFMDIHLSDGAAFNIFNLVQIDIPIIFTTAYDEYAIEAFEVNSIDYLLKPIDVKKVRQALEKFRRWNRQDIAQYLNMLPQLLPAGKYREKILITENNMLTPVSVNEISCFYTADEKTVIILKNGTNYPHKGALEHIMQSLNPFFFYRVNKQYIIAKESIKNITIWFDNRLLLTLETDNIPEQIFVSKNKAAEFKRWISE